MESNPRRPFPSSSAPVLVVGAGPTGLFTAITLARQGVAVDVIEKRVDSASGSKALSLSPLSAQLIDDAGALAPFLRSARPTRAFNVRYGDDRICRIDFRRLAARHPYFLMQPQPETEAMLEARLRELGGQVRRGASLESLVQDDQGVIAAISVAGLPAELKRYQYVVGSDGARSRVRSAIGAEFAGYDYSGMHFILADCKVDWDGDLSEAHYFVREQGFMVLAPLTGALHRVVIQVKAPFDPARKPDFAEFEALSARIAPRGVRLRDPVWISSAPFYNRLASSNRAGRVFLAGDATHLFSPIGGMGMNTGLGDAFNLGWKLGYVLTGRAPESLLDTYARERLELAAQLVKQTDHSTSLVARLDRHAATDELRFLPRMANRAFMRRMLPLQASGFGQAYGESPDPRVGRLAPYVTGLGPGLAQGTSRDSASLFAGLRHTVLIAVHSISSGDAAFELAERLGREFGHFTDIRILDSSLDPHARLAGALKLRDGDLALVRPDAYVELASDLARADQLMSHLRRHYRSTSPVRAPKEVSHVAFA